MSDHLKNFLEIGTGDNQKEQDQGSVDGKEKYPRQTLIASDAFANMCEGALCDGENEYSFDQKMMDASDVFLGAIFPATHNQHLN